MLIAILSLYLALAALYSFATRLKWGPDEPAHFVYVQSVALDFRLPDLPPIPADYAGRELPASYSPGHAISHQRQQPPLYYALAALPYRLLHRLPTDAIWLRLRWFSILLGLAALALQWRLLRLLFPRDPTVCLAALAVLAFLPMFTYLTSVVNNDGLATVMFTASAYQWVRLLSGKTSVGNVALAGALAGLAVLTKESALALLPGLVIAVALTSPAGERRSWARRLGRAALALGIAAVISAGWFAYNLATYGKPTVYAYLRPAYHSLSEALADPYGPGGLVTVLGVAIDRTFIFLWLPWWVVVEHARKLAVPYKLGMALLSATAFVGLLLALLDRWRRKTGLSARQAQALGLMLLTAVMLILGVLRYILFVDYTALQAGRYLIVVWPLLSIMGVVGLGTLLKTAPAKAVGLSALALLWLALNLAVLWLDYLTYHG